MRKESAFQLRQSLILLLTAVIWGIAFVAQSVGMEYVGPYTFIAVRYALGALVLVPVILLRRKIKASGRKEAGNTGLSRSRDISGTVPAEEDRAGSGRKLWIGGALCGTALMIASGLQQFGIMRTTVGKAGFITAMYIIIVPILGILTKRKIRPHIWLCVLIAVAGLYLLSMNGSFVLQDGDALCLACAFVFAVQIILIDHYTLIQRVDSCVSQEFNQLEIMKPY